MALYDCFERNLHELDIYSLLAARSVLPCYTIPCPVPYIGGYRGHARGSMSAVPSPLTLVHCGQHPRLPYLVKHLDAKACLPSFHSECRQTNALITAHVSAS